MEKIIAAIKSVVPTPEEKPAAKKARDTPWRQGQKGPLWRENPYFEGDALTQSEQQKDFSTKHLEVKDKIENLRESLAKIPSSSEAEKIQSTPVRKSLSIEVIQSNPQRSPSKESLVFSPASPLTPRLLKSKEGSSPSTPRGNR